MIAIGVEAEYKYVARSIYVRGPKGEHNASIATGIEVTDFLRWLKLI
jgi:hypothetical protein